MDATFNDVESPVDMCSRYKKSKESDERCIILIHLFGGYSFSEVLHARVACVRNTREVLHKRLQGAGMELHGACMDFHVACKEIPFLLRGSFEVCNKKH